MINVLTENLDPVLETFDRAMAHSTKNEALICVHLNVILLFILDMVNRTQPFGAKEMLFQMEMYFKIDVTSKLCTRALKGYPDFSLWYGEPDRVETNLVIVEAKSEDFIGITEPQELAYMCEL